MRSADHSESGPYRCFRAKVQLSPDIGIKDNAPYLTPDGRLRSEGKRATRGGYFFLGTGLGAGFGAGGGGGAVSTVTRIRPRHAPGV